MTLAKKMLVLTGTMLIFQLSGCASAPAPTGLMARAEAAMSMARQAEADRWASAQMGKAVLLLDEAAEFEARRKYKEAAELAELAEAHAKLAKAMSDVRRMRALVKESAQEVDALRDQLQGGY